jgi:hypothetical protein
MNVFSRRSLRRLSGIGALGLGLVLVAEAQAGWPRARRVRVVTAAPVARVVPTTTTRVADVAPSPMLGSFYPDNYANIRGNFEAGGGYSPLGTYGDTSATLYGPLSSFRSTSAPVLLYERGYDGSFRPGLGTGFSTPNLPVGSPVVYPTRANAVGAPRRVSTPPQWDSGINWIDLN